MKKLLKGLSLSLFCLLAGWTAYIANNGNGVNQDVELSDVEALAYIEIYYINFATGEDASKRQTITAEQAQRLLDTRRSLTTINQMCPYPIANGCYIGTTNNGGVMYVSDRWKL